MADQNKSYVAVVQAKTRINSGFIRISCSHTHPSLSSANSGGYIKLVFPLDGGGEKKRTISLSSVQKDLLQLDFVDHGKEGAAANWARNCQPGDKVKFLGPGKAADIDLSLKHFRIAGDKTAFPAIFRQLSRIDHLDFASCHICLIVDDTNDKNYFDGFLNRERLLFRTFSREEFDAENFARSAKIEEAALWIAGERLVVNAVRSSLKRLNVKLNYKYASSYWQSGVDQETHKRLKKEDNSEG